MYVNGSVISAGSIPGAGQAGESLIRQSAINITTVRIAFRAKQRRFDDFDGLLEESASNRCSEPSWN